VGRDAYNCTGVCISTPPSLFAGGGGGGGGPRIPRSITAPRPTSSPCCLPGKPARALARLRCGVCNYPKGEVSRVCSIYLKYSLPSLFITQVHGLKTRVKSSWTVVDKCLPLADGCRSHFSGEHLLASGSTAMGASDRLVTANTETTKQMED
jgi:hypothetical protein